MKRRFKRAFTITELVIVIAVIAILAAVLIPTFSHVVDESKKSHDQQYMKEINVALANYTAKNGAAPAEYEEAMLALADAGMCDTNNPFLLGTALQQENVLLVWYPNSDKVQLIDTSNESMMFSSERGYGNYILLGDNKTMSSNGCFILCNTGHKDSMYAAEAYRQVYILAGGDVSNLGSFDAEELVKDMENKSWANGIVSAVRNAKNGYTYNEGRADSILETFKSQSSAQVDLTENLSTADQTVLQQENNFDKLSENGKAVVQQSVRSTLATLATLQNDSTTAQSVAGKTVELDVPEGTVVSMKDVAITPIGTACRKEEKVSGGTPASTLSVDYGGLTLEDLVIEPNNYVSTGAEYQTQGDSGYPGGGYAFTYGLFGTIIAAPGKTVTIENLHLRDVNVDLSGASETVGANTVKTYSDNAGIIAGYVQGNVTFRDITIDGRAAGVEEGRGLIKAYDGVAGVVGRAYGYVEDGKNKAATLTLENVHVSHMDIKGERRAAGFVGYTSRSESLIITDCSLTDVVVTCERVADLSAGGNVAQCWAMAIANVGHDAATFTNITLEDVATGVLYHGISITENERMISEGADALTRKKYVYLEENPCRETLGLTGYAQYTYLLLTREIGFTGENIKIVTDGKTYTLVDSQKYNVGETPVTLPEPSPAE